MEAMCVKLGATLRDIFCKKSKSKMYIFLCYGHDPLD